MSRRPHDPRRLAGAGLFVAGLAAGFALMPVMGEAGPVGGALPAAGDGTPGIVQVQADTAAVQALEARIRELERKIGVIGSTSDVPPDGNAVVRAPFMVLGSNGQALLSVSDDGGTAVLELGDPGGLGSVRLESQGSRGSFIASNGDASVRLQTDGKNSFLMTDSSQGSTVLGTSDIGWGLYLNKASGEPAAEIATKGGGDMAVRVYDSGNAVMIAGHAPGEGGSVRVFASSGARAAAALNTNDDGSGTVQVWSSSGEKAASLDGGKRLISVQAEEGAVQIGQGSATWGLFLKDKSGTPKADLSQPNGRGMGLRVYEGGHQVAGIGQSVGQGGTVRVFSTGGDDAGASMNAYVDGSGDVLVNGAGGAAAVQLSGLQRFVAVFNKSETLVSFLGLGSDGAGGNFTANNASGMKVVSGGSGPDGGGDLCVARIENGTTCLGIGLPMQ